MSGSPKSREDVRLAVPGLQSRVPDAEKGSPGLGLGLGLGLGASVTDEKKHRLEEVPVGMNPLKLSTPVGAQSLVGRKGHNTLPAAGTSCQYFAQER